MENFLTTFINYAIDNEMFAGIVGASLIGGLFFLLRSVPMRLIEFFKFQFTVVIKISNSDELFDLVSRWLATNPYAKRTRRLRVVGGELNGVPIDEDDAINQNITLAPGEGLHWFPFKNRLIWIEHIVDRENARNNFLREYINIRVLGRNQQIIRELIDAARALKIENAGVDIRVYSDGWWQRIGFKALRPLNTLVLPIQIEKQIIKDAKDFFDHRAWYLERGVPYRRGYLLSGPPGTGKSSLVMALASELNIPIYVLTMGGIEDDNSLINAFLNVPHGSILLLEDIDVSHASNIRKKQKKSETKGFTLSGLLNAIDGVYSADGRLLIMTTNMPEKLDAALIRPGRVDWHIELGLINKKQGKKMFQRFYPDECSQRFLKSLDWPQSPATVQGALQKFGVNK